MSITNSDLVSDALREIGVLDETETASAEMFSNAIRKLNQMMEAWEVQGITLGYFAQTLSSDDCPIPIYAEAGVICSLAVRLSPTYGASITPELGANVEAGMRVILRESVSRALPTYNGEGMPCAEAGVLPWNILTGP